MRDIIKKLIILSLLFCIINCEDEEEKEESIGPIIGIDLGTTYSCVGIFQNGHVDIIANDQGNRITPSYVAWDGDDRLIGDAAKNQATINPERTVFDVKRLIGRHFNDKSVQHDMKMWPFHLIDKGNKPYIRINIKGADKDFSKK